LTNASRSSAGDVVGSPPIGVDTMKKHVTASGTLAIAYVRTPIDCRTASIIPPMNQERYVGSHSRAPSGRKSVVCTKISQAGVSNASPANPASHSTDRHRRRHSKTTRR
jgi:hypothetical protein